MQFEQKLVALTEKKKKLDAYRPLPAELVKNLANWFKVELTYTSNALEGNTLSRQETALVVEKGLTVKGKSLQEHLEAVNHAEAIEFLKNLVGKKRTEMNEGDLLAIHKLILTKIDDLNAGRYRTVPVRIAGSLTVLPNPMKVPDLMKEFATWLKKEKSDHPAKIAADAHFRLVSIHPFTDGNGRTARLLMNLLLEQKGYPPALIRKEDRQAYISALEEGQTRGKTDNYYNLIFQAVNRSLNIYLKDLQPAKAKSRIEPAQIWKIGELSQKTKETVPTLRYWIKEGLLEAQDQTAGGYMLFGPDAIERIKDIRQLQKEKRLSIAEIKQQINNL